MKTTQVPDPWYVEQQGRIDAADSEAASARARMRRLFDPGHLYVVVFDSGVVKVGKADNVAARIKAHTRTGFVIRSYASPRHLHMSKTERQLIAFCNEFGTLHGGHEYFRDIDADAVRAYAHVLVRNARRQEYLERLIEAADGDLSVTWQDAHERLGEGPIGDGAESVGSAA